MSGRAKAYEELNTGALGPAEFKKLVDRSVAVIQKYKTIMGLSNWHIACYAQRLEEHKAEIETWPEYREAEITVNPFRLYCAGDVELEECLVHELGHCIVEGFVDQWKTMEKKGRDKLKEGLVSDITGAVLRAIRATKA